MSFDPDRLKQDLNQISPEQWTPHFNTGYYEGEWSGVALRSVGGSATALYPDPAAQIAFADTSLLDACDYIQSVLASFKCEMESVRLLKLSAGSRIREHKDHKLSLEDGLMRIHIPITTNPRVEFFVNNIRLVMNAGECWYINFNLPHRVYNHSETERVHLVMDCVVNEWLRSMVPAREDASDQRPSALMPAAMKPQKPEMGFDGFRQFVLADETLQERLMATPELNDFLNLTVQLGNKHGYSFTIEDVEAELRKSHNAWLQRWI
jgi:Aspartyl/Asparaginyl beta-hydroxylase/Nif11 domain